MKEKAILWDLNGVLLLDEPLQKQCWQQALQEFEIVLPPNWWADLFLGRNMLDSLPEAFPYLSADQIQDLLTRKQQIYSAEAERSGWPVNEGALELMKAAKREGWQQALVTGSSAQEAQQAIQKLGAEALFEAVIDGQQVSQGKPSPEGYLRATELLRLPAAKCWAIEDSLPGLQAAKQAGCLCLAFTSSLDAKQMSAADLTVSALGPDTLQALSV
jgi:HAD superfamily hydrolase (TIGR01509 family)